MLRVLVAYEGELGEALESALGPHVRVARVESARQAVAATSELFDVLVLKRRLPDGDGVELAEKAISGGFHGRILVIGESSSTADLVDVLRRGADDYARHPVAIEELVARVHALGRRAGGAHRLDVGPLRLDLLERRAFLHDEELAHITPRELDLLQILARAEGWTSTSNLARSLFGQSANARRQLQVAICRIRGKLGVDAGLLETGSGLGYRLRRRLVADPQVKIPRGTLSR